MPAVALSGVIVLNTTHGGNEIILMDRAIYRRKPFGMRSSPVYTTLLEAQDPWGRLRGVVRAHRPLSFLTMARSMAQRTPVSDRRGLHAWAVERCEEAGAGHFVRWIARAGGALRGL